MSKRDTGILIEDMLQAATACLQYTEGMSFKTFCLDNKTVDAVCRCLQILGEAARKVPDEIVIYHASIPWAQMRGLRNRIVHEYFDINLERTWIVIERNLPTLIPQLKALLKTFEDNSN